MVGTLSNSFSLLQGPAHAAAVPGKKLTCYPLLLHASSYREGVNHQNHKAPETRALPKGFPLSRHSLTSLVKLVPRHLGTIIAGETTSIAKVLCCCDHAWCRIMDKETDFELFNWRQTSSMASLIARYCSMTCFKTPTNGPKYAAVCCGMLQSLVPGPP